MLRPLLVAAAVGLLSATSAVATPGPDGSSWIPVAAGAEMPRIAAFDVHADRGIVIMDTRRAGGARFAMATFRRSGTGAVRTGAATLGLGPTVVFDVVSDRRGGWLVLSHPTDASAASRATRIRADARVDRAYGDSGSTLFNAQSTAIDVDDAGRAWVVGPVYIDSMPTNSVAVTRIARTGALDVAYGPRGTAIVALPSVNAADRLGVDGTDVVSFPYAVAVNRSGHVVIAGTTSSRTVRPVVGNVGFLARLGGAGTLDPAFGVGGLESYGPVRPASMNSNGIYGQSAGIEPTFGNIYVSGVPARDSKTVVWKRTARGSRYGSFINHGWLRLASLNQTSQLGATCNGGLWIVDTSVLQVRTRTGQPDRRFAPGGRISLRGGAQLRRAHGAAFDAVSCRLTAAQIGVRGRTTGVIVRSFATPRR